MAKAHPTFTYSGSYDVKADDTYWYIYLKSDGTLTMSYDQEVDVWLVGAGGGGANDPYNSNGGGGGGMTMGTDVKMVGGTGYYCDVGAGGAQNQDGYDTTFIGLRAGGGKSGINGGTGGSGTYMGGAGNSGSGRYLFNSSAYAERYGGGGGVGAYSGSVGSYGAGTGVDGGGNGGAAWPGGAAAAGTAGAANTGGGGGGTGRSQIDSDGSIAGNAGGPGGSGIVVIRGKGGDFLPVFLNGTRISKIMFNGVQVGGLIVDGVKLFARRAMQAAKGHAARDCGGRREGHAGFAVCCQSTKDHAHGQLSRTGKRHERIFESGL